MPRITVTINDETRRIEIVGQWSDYESVLRAHGYDPDSVDWSVDDPDSELQTAIQNASNLQELKTALTNNDHPAKSRDRGR